MILYDVCKGPQLLTALYVSACVVMHTLCTYITKQNTSNTNDWGAPRLHLEEDQDGGCARREHVNAWARRDACNQAEVAQSSEERD